MARHQGPTIRAKKAEMPKTTSQHATSVALFPTEVTPTALTSPPFPFLNLPWDIKIMVWELVCFFPRNIDLEIDESERRAYPEDVGPLQPTEYF